MKSLILFLSLCLGLQCASPTWDEFPVAKISVHHREEDFSHLSQLQLAFKEALDTKQESLEISSYLRKNYGDETEALQEVRDLFFSVQSLPSYFIYRPEIRAYCLQPSRLQVHFDPLLEVDAAVIGAQSDFH